MGKMRALSKAALMLGVLLMALAAYQLNQYYTAGVQTNAVLKYSEQQCESSAIAELGMDKATCLEQLKQTTGPLISESQSMYLNSGVVDLFVGLILLVLSVLYNPDEVRH